MHRKQLPPQKIPSGQRLEFSLALLAPLAGGGWQPQPQAAAQKGLGVHLSKDTSKICPTACYAQYQQHPVAACSVVTHDSHTQPDHSRGGESSRGGWWATQLSPQHAGGIRLCHQSVLWSFGARSLFPWSCSSGRAAGHRGRSRPLQPGAEADLHPSVGKCTQIISALREIGIPSRRLKGERQQALSRANNSPRH